MGAVTQIAANFPGPGSSLVATGWGEPQVRGPWRHGRQAGLGRRERIGACVAPAMAGVRNAPTRSLAGTRLRARVATMRVLETFVSLDVADMARATRFYTGAFGASVSFASPAWSSLHVAGVRVGLHHNPHHRGVRAGLHLVVDDMAAALAAVEHAGGRIVSGPGEVAPGVVVAEVADSEGNGFALRRA